MVSKKIDLIYVSKWKIIIIKYFNRIQKNKSNPDTSTFDRKILPKKRLLPNRENSSSGIYSAMFIDFTIYGWRIEY